MNSVELFSSAENEKNKLGLAEVMVGLMNLLMDKEILPKIIIKHISYDDVEGEGFLVVGLKDDSEKEEIKKIIANSQELKLFGEINFNLDEEQMILQVNFKKNKEKSNFN